MLSIFIETLKMNPILSILGSTLLSGSRIEGNRDFMYCLMENKAHNNAFSSKGTFANAIELNNLCSHFRGDLRRDCMNYMDVPSLQSSMIHKDSSSCMEYLDMKIKNQSTHTEKWSKFIDYMMDYDKIYDNDSEITSRFNIFHDNLEWMAEHNRDSSHTYTVGIGRFADMTHNEYKDFVKSGGLFDGTDMNLRGNLGLPKDMCGTMTSQSGSYPAKMDWREKGAVTPVRNQGQQGTCYAHSASEALESAYFIKKGTLPNLSVQQIVDCSYNYGNHGNNGGMFTYSWTYIRDSGLTTEAAYPYTAGPSDRSSCQPFTPYTYVSDCKHVPSNELQLTYAVAKQPVSVAIEADSRSFQHYESGVYNDPACGTDIDHAVVVVGYGTMDGQDYWTTRNSWGTSFGLDGYILIARNSVATSTVGQCAIATYAAYPIV
jgi:C1A family cysteine protease